MQSFINASILLLHFFSPSPCSHQSHTYFLTPVNSETILPPNVLVVYKIRSYSSAKETPPLTQPLFPPLHTAQTKNNKQKHKQS